MFYEAGQLRGRLARPHAAWMLALAASPTHVIPPRLSSLFFLLLLLLFSFSNITPFFFSSSTSISQSSRPLFNFIYFFSFFFLASFSSCSFFHISLIRHIPFRPKASNQIHCLCIQWRCSRQLHFFQRSLNYSRPVREIYYN